MKRSRIIYATLLLVSLLSINVMTQTKQNLSDAPTVNFCVLIRNPALYDQKIIRVRTFYMVTWQGSLLSNADCYGKDVWVKFDPSFQKLTESKIYQKFKRLTDTSLINESSNRYGIKGAEIVATGQFEVVQLREKLGNVARRREFSYLGAYDLQFTVFSIGEFEEISAPRNMNYY